LREETKIERIGKKMIFLGLILFLFVPLLQTVSGFKNYIRPLDGAYYPEGDVDFSWQGWFHGDYQSQKDKFLKENFGLHNYYFRLICQINFSLFKKANATYLVVGKDNYLYESDYIDAYYGRDFIGEKKIENFVKKLKSVQDTLRNHNKLIFLVLAPGKACFYPEYIPENYKTKKTKTNYEGFIDAIKRNALNHIDFYNYYTSKKYTSIYPLYPQLGIHWSNYASVYAFDSIVKYTEKELSTDLPDISIKSVTVHDSLKAPDNDAVKSLNLYKDPKTFKMAYCKWEIKNDRTKNKKLNLLVVSDSFWWYIYGTNLTNSTFATSSFWYYNEEIYPESYSSPLLVSQIDYTAKIRKADVIILLHTEATLNKFGGGFVDMAYETYCHPGLKKEKIQEMKGKIRSTSEWFKNIIIKAGERNISVDSMLTLDAIYTLESMANDKK